MSNYKGFSTVKLKKPKQSTFDLSHERRLSTRMGRLTPIFISEVIPNDSFTVSSEVMLRLAPLLAPIMHQVNVFVHYFYIPNRLLWKDWENFITNGRLGTETPPVPPYMTIFSALDDGADKLDVGSLYDYLGGSPIPDTESSAWETVGKLNLLPFAAYYKVYYDYYRDRNFEADNDLLPLSSGSQLAAGNQINVLRTRKWSHDYFTSALPWTQRGSDVLIPMEGTADVNYSPYAMLRQEGGGEPGVGAVTGSNPLGILQAGGDNVFVENIDSVEFQNSSVSVEDLTRARRLQEWLQRNALAGSRYTESIKAHFGRNVSDSRLQRAEYLGGGKIPVQISEVVTTAYSEDSDAATVPPGNMAGHGITTGGSNRFKYNCEEHGFVIGIMSVMPTPAYMQGTPRMFVQRDTFLDYPWPTFAHLGEQEVYKYELFQSPANLSTEDRPVFGYQSRYADWKYMQSTNHGDFRSSLDFWTLTRKFETAPSLGFEFLTFEDELQDRIFAVSGVDTLWCYIYNHVKVRRSLPYYGTPMM